MKNIIFIAPPASGKGTMSSLLIEKYGYTHISTGDILRDMAKIDDELGQTIKALLEYKGIQIEKSEEYVYKLSPSQSTTATKKQYIKLSSIKDIFNVYEEFN